MKLQQLVESNWIRSGDNDIAALLFALRFGSTIKLLFILHGGKYWTQFHPTCDVRFRDIEGVTLKLENSSNHWSINAKVIGSELWGTVLDRKVEVKKLELRHTEIERDITGVKVININKAATIKGLLHTIKHDNDLEFVLEQVKELKKIRKWPELDAIQKSLESSVKK